jgi:hypothetical protein
MAKIIYTGSDVEELVARGVKQLELGPGVSITDVGRELAEQYGIKLVRPADARPAGVGPVAASAASPARPRGCQHGPLSATAGASASPAATAPPSGNAEGVVGRLVGIVSKLADRGG